MSSCKKPDGKECVVAGRCTDLLSNIGVVRTDASEALEHFDASSTFVVLATMDGQGNWVILGS